MGYLAKNNAYSTLASSLTNVATTMTVQTGHGDRFPVIAGADFTIITLEDAAGNIEIVRVTARASGSNSMTITRAQEGTTARAWAAGDIVELRPTAATLQTALEHVDDADAAHAASAISYAGGTGLVATNVEAAIDELANEKADITTLDAHLNDTADAHDASAISFSPAGNIGSTNVQAAIVELDSEKLSTGGTALKANDLTGGNNTTLLGAIPYQQNTDDTALLAPNTATVRKYLAQTGTGTNGAPPQWVEAPLLKVIEFTASGTFDYAAEITAGRTMMLVELIGGGGSGAYRSTTGNASGGGGGGYYQFLIPLSKITATSPLDITVGSGGAAPSGSNLNGNDGGNTEIELSSLTNQFKRIAFGGKGGVQAAAGTAVTGGNGGGYGSMFYLQNEQLVAGGNGTANAFAANQEWVGGGGSGVSSGNVNTSANYGTSMYGGKGGRSINSAGSRHTSGDNKLSNYNGTYGDGGDGGLTGTPATAGQPGFVRLTIW